MRDALPTHRERGNLHLGRSGSDVSSNMSSSPAGFLLPILLAAAPTLGGASAASTDFSGLVDIGGGRRMYLECRGAGFPTVLLVSGKGNRADIWSTPSSDEPGPTVFAEVAKQTRVCAYDRPGTTGALASEPSRSDEVREPVTIADGVADLHALLAAGLVPGPYVLAGHSMGGLIGRLFASQYGDEVAGLVLVDALSEDLYNGLTDEQRAVFEKLNDAPERYDNVESFKQIRAADAVRPMPVVVLTAGQRADQRGGCCVGKISAGGYGGFRRRALGDAGAGPGQSRQALFQRQARHGQGQRALHPARSTRARGRLVPGCRRRGYRNTSNENLWLMPIPAIHWSRLPAFTIGLSPASPSNRSQEPFSWSRVVSVIQ